jgi:hypothetical protein
MHILHYLDEIILHREYIPFIALNCRETGPIGPLDEPKFPEEVYGNHREFWRQSACRCFEAARELTNLLCKCDEMDVLVETPLSMFAAFTVAVCGELYMLRNCTGLELIVYRGIFPAFPMDGAWKARN